MVKVLDGVKCNVDDHLSDMEDSELRKYIQYVKDRVDTGAKHLEISVIQCDDGGIDLNYELRDEPFERIRRITGSR